MKKFYSKFRIALMTFALGLASVFVMNGSLQFSDEVQVNLPKTKSGEILIVYPKYAEETPMGKYRGLFADYENRIIIDQESSISQ
jgi:hypothetical protein